MRAIRRPLAGMIVLGLLGGLPVVAVAQDEAEPVAPAYFTFTTGTAVEFSEGEARDIDGIATQLRGGGVIGIPLEATDPRVSCLVAFRHNADTFAREGDQFTSATTSVRLDNDGGAWTGTSTSVIAFTDAMARAEDIPRTTELTVLTGEGGYEGLTVVMSASHDGENETTRGVIAPAYGMPPVPDAIEQPPGA